ncbi:MAG TPA: cation:proton antiporter [Candidatus Polarisedimenticolaceae bacterium]|nr:cation:proton antiporter [Candidatus Polarisedimenticolaceae bacterium]
MTPDHASHAAFSVAVALATGMVAQSLARHLRIPGIVLLLAAGVLLGPDALDMIDPKSLGSALQVLVGFAVAVILFEGGLNLSLSAIRRQVGVIPRLITVGALVTAVGGTLLARLVMGWSWSLSALFGALVVVTGPTVITPLLRRIKVTHRVETILEAEGVLIDAIGAVLAVVTLEVVLSFSAASLAEGAMRLVELLGFGLIAGLFGGLAIAFLLRFNRVVPPGFENVLTLSLVLALYQACNAVMAESGIMAVTAAGVVVGNVRTRALRDLMEFKEQLTMMFIGLLFVLLAADVRIRDVLGLGWPGVWTVAGLMFLVRPLNIWLCTLGSDLTHREKVFLAWLAPRGVVAAAVASLFAQTLDNAGVPGGGDLRALVFLVIAITVNVEGSTGGLVASLLGLRRAARRGYVILGANALGRTLGRLLVDAGIEVVIIDNNPAQVRVAETAGFRVIYGNAVEERTLLRAGIDERVGAIGLTPNDEVNLLFARAAHDDYRLRENYIALRHGPGPISSSVVEAHEAQVLFGKPRDLVTWMVRIRRDLCRIERFTLVTTGGSADAESPFAFPEQLILPLALYRGSKIYPIGSARKLKKGDVIAFALFAEELAQARRWLSDNHWQEEAQADRPAEVERETGTGSTSRGS